VILADLVEPVGMTENTTSTTTWAAAEFHRLHVAPLPRTRRKAKDQPTEGEQT
jgi:hypothetical protein